MRFKSNSNLLLFMRQGLNQIHRGQVPSIGCTTFNLGICKMRISSSENVAGRMIRENLGPVRAMEFATTADLKSALEVAKEKVIAAAKALGGDAIINLLLEVVEMSNGLFSAIVTGQVMRTVARQTNWKSLFETDDLQSMVKPYMMQTQLAGAGHFLQ
jgi:hypothetical protein